MKIFITGATGFIGHAVASELARAGHVVTGLARSPDKARRLAAAEAIPVIGDMADPASYRAAAGEAQVLIHCAAEYSPKSAELDRKTVEALLGGARAAGRPRLLLYTSGCWLLGNTGGAADESAPLDPPAMVRWRVDVERLVLAGAGGPLRTIVLRPGCVYGGSGGLTASWFESAAKEGAARIVGDGSVRWSMVHVADLAAAYRLAAESAFSGEVFHVSDRSRFTVLDCARAASAAVNGSGKVVSTSVEEAEKAMGAMAECLMLDQHCDASKAARLLGWNPRHGGFADGAKRYHQSWKASR